MYYIIFGSLCGALAGTSMPFTGWIFSELIVYATAPFSILGMMATVDEDYTITNNLTAGKDYMFYNIKFWCIVISSVAFLASFFKIF